jgi:hypothetical protein
VQEPELEAAGLARGPAAGSQTSTAEWVRADHQEAERDDVRLGRFQLLDSDFM